LQQCNAHGTQAQEKAKPDASAIYVPGNQTAKAIEEAIEAEIPLIVAVAEHVPIHDLLRVGALALGKCVVLDAYTIYRFIQY
jgi:succinyl-CoA synthetase alpha subunit